MKNRRAQFAAILIAVVLVGGVGVATYTHAQTSTGTSGTSNQTTSTTNTPKSFSTFSGLLGFFEGYATGGLGGGITGAVESGYGLTPCSLISFSLKDCINEGLANISNIALSISNLVLALSGTILNGVMIITLNMSALVDSTGVIDSTWAIVRDISSIVIIFFLLYVSIRMIIGLDNANLRHIIVMVALAGILLNFSLFFTKLAVDASNLVGLAFYRAIAPSGANLNLTSSAYTGNVTTSDYASNAFTSGGISDEFMQALQIQKADAYQSSGGTNAITIIQAGLYGTILQLVAAVVFLGAALLFFVRTGILILLMVLSPFYFVGLIVPKIKAKISEPWLDMLIDQCLILPIFMFFMYIAIRIITNPAFQGIVNPNGAQVNGAGSNTVGMFIQYGIAIIFICLALFAALKYASVGKGAVNSLIKTSKKWASNGLRGTAGFAGRNTFGLAASKVGESEQFRKFAASSPILGGVATSTLKNISSASFGGKKGGFDAAQKSADKARVDLHKKIGTVNRDDYATEDAYNDAKRRALTMQRTYIDTLKNTPMAKFMGADRSAWKMEEGQQKAETKAALGESQERSKQISKELEEIAKLQESAKASTDNPMMEHEGQTYQMYTPEQMPSEVNASYNVLGHNLASKKIGLEAERMGLNKKIKDLQKKVNKEEKGKMLRALGKLGEEEEKEEKPEKESGGEKKDEKKP